jgi:hypothetical protein
LEKEKMNSVRKNQLLIPPNRGPRKVVVEKIPEGEDGTALEEPGGRIETQAVTNTSSMVPELMD